MNDATDSGFGFETKVIIRQRGSVFSVLRGPDAVTFLEGLPSGVSEAERQSYIAQFVHSYLIKVWLAIGRANHLIMNATSASLDDRVFCPCASLEELRERLSSTQANSSRAYYYGPLCFIQQTNDKDGWLVIRDHLPFEMVACKSMIEKGEFDSWLRRVSVATDAQLKSLNY
jgi:hypothetical protein